MGNKWRFMVAAVAAAWLAVPGAVQPASAALLTGGFSFTGQDTYLFATHNLTIIPNTSTVNLAVGSFAPLLNSAITFTQCLGPLGCDYTNISGQLFTGINNLSFTFNGTAQFLEGGAFPNDLSIGGLGVIAMTGFDPTPGIFGLSSQLGNGTTTVTFSATTVAVPGPVLGAGLPGLVLACGGLLALARRRRQQVAA